MIFNIYYINIAKVYEISMMIDNLNFKNITRETTESDEITSNSNMGFSLNYLDSVKSNLGISESNKLSSSKKIIENIEIITTKSILLRKIISKSKQVKSLTDLNEGDLIKIENINLQLNNDLELRQVKAMSNGAFKGFNYEGIDISNLINSMLKDYSYVLTGSIDGENIILKIPMQFEGEFENLYNIDDLLIGSITIVGIYKKEIKKNQIKNTFSIMQEIGKSTQNNNSFIEKSSTEHNEEEVFSKDESNYHFIDTIAIIQDIYKKEEFEQIQLGLFRRFIRCFKTSFSRKR